ncbi:uncharacterized protein [Euwallacea fornicatus]|uniref:uncharacterized protein n=1 Tax=Euwallacea fornicatus TaxID=995702 RepID=UPI00338F11E2
MQCRRNKNLLMVAGLVLLSLQNSASADANVEQCKQKFLEHAKAFDFNHVPQCLDQNKVNEARESTKIFGELFGSFPVGCKPGDVKRIEDVKKCFQQAVSRFMAHTDEIEAGITNGLKALVDGSQTCIDNAVAQFSGLEDYIAKGCPDTEL